MQQTHEELKGLSQFKTPKGYTKDVATRFASKYDCMTRAVVLNPATRIVMNLPSYSAKYEDKSVDAPKDDSDDEYEKKIKENSQMCSRIVRRNGYSTQMQVSLLTRF